MEEICEYYDCTGCGACASICPKKCIILKEDTHAEVHPCIDNSVCINCAKCKNVCPNNSEIKYHYPNHCYAAWRTNKSDRLNSASGGLAAILYEYVLSIGGIAVGVFYDDDFNAVLGCVNSKADLEKLKGSKYTHARIDPKLYEQIQERLKDSITVLFIATPCQVSVLKSYLKADYENLITCDLICHGVSPQRYFKEEIASYKSKHNLTNITFRSNTKNNNYSLVLWTGRGKSVKVVKRIPASEDYYFRGFLSGITLRENCYQCKYARPDRIADITLGDFIGLGQSAPFPYKEGNVSSVTINTEKGESLYNRVLEYSNGTLISVERPYEERLAYKPSLLEPFPKHPLAPKFRQLLEQYGYYKAIRIVLVQEIKQEQRKRMTKKILTPFTFTKRVVRKIGKIISKN